MKLLVFIDFTAFCVGKKKTPHISPQVCPVSNGSHGCQQIPNPFLLRWEGHTGGQHVHVQQLQQTRLGGVLARDGLIWKDFWKGFWVGRLRILILEQKGLSTHLILKTEGWVWGLQDDFPQMEIAIFVGVSLCYDRFSGGNWHRKNQPHINPIWARKSWEERMNITVHWKKHTPTLALTAKFLRVVIDWHLSSNSIEFGDPHFAGGDIFNYRLFNVCEKLSWQLLLILVFCFFLSPGWCVMMYPFWGKCCSTMSTRDLQRDKGSMPVQLEKEQITITVSWKQLYIYIIIYMYIYRQV